MKEGEYLKLEGKRIGFILTGSFFTFKKTIEQMKNIVRERAEVLPIMSYTAYKTDTRFGRASEFIAEIEEITQNKVIHTIKEAEQIGPKYMTDIVIVAPASR